nr:retrovirus-related Pol polyprotein from transposon TNT 1-94 [Tanacetum cinerariifolium]
KTRRPQPRSNTKNDRVPSTSKSSQSKNKGDELEEHHRNLLLSKNTKHMSSACNNIKLDSQNVISKVVCAMWQFCDSDLEVAFRRNACFVRNLEGVDLLKGDRSTNLYTINLHEMASASPICLMARLPKFKYHKEHLCPSCEQGKSKRASHPPKPVLNSRHRLHLLHMDLCGPMRIASINGKWALCYPKNDHEDIGKLGTKGLDLTYAPSTITTHQPTEGELDLLFEAMYDDYIGGQPSATVRTVLPAQEPQVR